jgi:hypothetical protein
MENGKASVRHLRLIVQQCTACKLDYCVHRNDADEMSIVISSPRRAVHVCFRADRMDFGAHSFAYDDPDIEALIVKRMEQFDSLFFWPHIIQPAAAATTPYQGRPHMLIAHGWDEISCEWVRHELDLPPTCRDAAKINAAIGALVAQGGPTDEDGGDGWEVAGQSKIGPILTIECRSDRNHLAIIIVNSEEQDD